MIAWRSTRDGYRLVLAVGGWDSFHAIEPYLNAPSTEVVNEAFEEAGLT